MLAVFNTSFWRRATVAALGVVAFYKFAPSPNEDNYFSRLLTHYNTPAEYWAKLNTQHLFLSASEQSEQLVIADAKKSPVHRYRYPQ